MQTIKRILSAIQLEENCPNIQDSLKSIIYELLKLRTICTTKNHVIRFLLFEFQFGRKTKSEWSIMSDNLKEKLNLVQQNLARDALTPEKRREACDSRPRVKFIHHGQSSRSVSPRFKVASDLVADNPSYQVLEDLAKSAGR